ncbi:MAG TPA: M28 family peptidase [Bryobacteraceae bacterium]|jgi:Zn-dependent M28 family amino/carboxypeptidase|nr:M28 family peptidase [Bryobacteraceae bacterium]
MVRTLFALMLASFITAAPSARAQDLHISGEKMRAHVKYLASDELEGRGVGTRGENLATQYIASQLQSEGLEPGGDNGTYFQRVPLIGSATLPTATLTISGKDENVPLSFVKDWVGTAFSQQPENDFDAEAVFVGHGISAPEFGWDDYKGLDVRGKVLVYFTNEPPSTDPNFFGGRALTYYGRWTYKFEEATRRGAVAALIIHTTPTAGYGWGVVSGSWSQEHPELMLKPGEHGLELAAWLSQDAGAKLIASTGKTLDELLAMADQKSFRPIPLGVHIAGHIPVKLRQIESRNVIGRVSGADPQLKSQAVLFTAHWDHLGIGVAVNGDKIYNGAVDNATGCAMVLEMARVWAALPEKPKRSALFLFVTAEESGLLGSEYYGEHPEVPAGLTAADINFDAFYPFGKTRDVSVTGSERTTLWPIVERDAKRLNLAITPDAEPEQGHFYRSDHFSLARVGIPAFSISQGSDYLGKPADFGKTVFEEYNAKHYHQPSDEYHDDWDFGGIEQMAQFGLTLGLDFANTPKLPTWNPGDEFLDARERSGVHSGQ